MKRLLLLVVAAATLIGAQPSSATWEAPQQIGAGHPTLGDVALSGNPRGDAVAAWRTQGGVSMAVARRGGAFGPALHVPGSRDGFIPQVAIDGHGNALVLWSFFDNSPAGAGEKEPCCYGTRLTVWNAATGRLRKVQSLVKIGHEVSSYAFAIRGGRIAVAWSERTVQGVAFRIAVRTSKGDYRLEPAVRLKAAGEMVGVALKPAGADATFTRFDRNGISLHELRARRGRVASTRNLAPGRTFGDVVAATNARGDQIIASSESPPERQFAGVRTSGGRFHVRQVSAAATDDLPRLMMTASGAAIAAWTTSDDRILVANRRPGKQFGAAREAVDSFGGGLLIDVQVGVNSSGQGVVAWAREVPGDVTRVRAAFYSATGVLSELQDFGPATTVGTQGAGAVDSRGRAWVLWDNGGIVNALRGHVP